ncbi:MAG: hypothetical protein QM723_08405 [Myxococcaceae bacterium]
MRALTLLCCLAVSTALAANVQLPYQGRLDKAGKPLSGSYDLAFTLFDSAGGSNVLWTDTFTAVPVAGGAFSVKLGGGVKTLDAAVLRGGSVFVAIAVQGPGETSFTALSGRQQVLTTPYAAQAQQDFAVPGVLTVGPDAGVPLVTLGNGALPLKVQTGTSTLTADGNSVDSNGTLNLQSRSGAATYVAGALSVSATGIYTPGSVQANNVWTKVLDTTTTLGFLNIPASPGKFYKVLIQGNWAATTTTGNLLLRINGLTSGYRGWVRPDGDWTGWVSDGTGMIMSWSADNVSNDFTVDATVAVAGGSVTMAGNHSMVQLSNGRNFIGIASGAWVGSSPNDLQLISTTGGICTVHVQVYQSP